MRTIIAVAMVSIALAQSAGGQNSADSAAIRRAALDYLEGYYDGNVERMDRALHPDFVKRTVTVNAATNHNLIRPLTKSMMLEYTRAGGGGNPPAEERGIEVRILDIFKNMATVRTEARDFIDYLHLAKWNGEWKIMNVLWEPNIVELPLSGEQRALYVGTYDLGQMELEVFEQGDSLMVRATGQQEVRLRYLGDHVFVGAPPADDVRLTFEIEGDRAVAFVLDQGGQTIRAPRRQN
jgi:hypothetical protein